MKCNICPRECKIDRSESVGVCGESDKVRVALASRHMWEEPCISGENGSGTVFFTGCPLHCVYCQNGVIANKNHGKEVTIEELSEIFLKQQESGVHNINLVTPTHFVLQIREALILAKEKGLVIPVVYNTGSYEKVESLRLLEGLVDIYLPDMKYFSSELAQKYSKAPDYFQVAMDAIEEMYRQVGEAQFDQDGMMKKGVIVRHLLLPGSLSDSKKVIKSLFEKFGDSVYISIMNQYTPMDGIGEKYPELAVKVSEKDYDELVDYAIDLGVENGFIQEGETASESFIPDFLHEV